MILLPQAANHLQRRRQPRMENGSTCLGSRPTSSSSSRPSLLTLPGEIRDIVYRMLLTTPYTYEEIESEFDRYGSYTFHPTILRTCKQIHREATGVLYLGNTWIVIHAREIDLPKTYPIESFWNEPRMTLPLIWTRDAKTDAERLDYSSKFPGYSLTLLPSFVTRDSHSMNSQQMVTHLTTAENLQEIPLCLWILCFGVGRAPGAWQPLLVMEVSKGKNPVPAKLERQILTALSSVRGFHRVEMGTNTVWSEDPRLLFKRMSTLPTKFEEVIQAARPYRHQGRRAQSSGKLLQACQYFEWGYYHATFTGMCMLTCSRDESQVSVNRQKLRRLLNNFEILLIRPLAALHLYWDVHNLVWLLRIEGGPELTVTGQYDVAICGIVASIGLGYQTASDLSSDRIWEVSDGIERQNVIKIGDAELDDEEHDIFSRLDSAAAKKEALSERMSSWRCWCGGSSRQKESSLHIRALGWGRMRATLTVPVSTSWSQNTSRASTRLRLGRLTGIDTRLLQYAWRSD